ncbi:MAG: NAD(P)H-dependent oxidoreductase [Verrucomicrobiales bacterium]|nr:NAD(P)H-dependent oxidoreductase [Verrucomicrobiales bacterium]
MATISSAQLLEQLRWRYATKSFDPEKIIPESDWDTLEESLILTPSSYGLQPWKFFVITNSDLKNSLVAASYNQRQVADCSHLLVIAVRTEMTVSDVDRLIETTISTRNADPGSLDGYKKMMIGDIVTGARSEDAVGWAKLQSYIALGNFMTSAALLGIDCCPMEGFVPSLYDEALGLGEKGLTTAVLCPAGYRADGDKYASAEKIRYPREDLIETVS